MSSNQERWLYSIGGVVAVFAALVAANFVLGVFPVRIDLTEGKLYTLSDGTKNILGKLEAPVRVRLYATQGDENVPVGMRLFASRVEDLLAEFRAASKGKLIVERLNPTTRLGRRRLGDAGWCRAADHPEREIGSTSALP